jgi:energy-coupling factor transporter transmembrane protein EcfT
MGLQLIIPKSGFLLIPFIIAGLIVRNRKALVSYLRFLVPTSLFLLILYFLFGHFKDGVHTVILLASISLSLQVYLSFYKELSLYDLLVETGFPKKVAFILYGALNYTLFIKPVIDEIQDAQRLRGIEIPHGMRRVFYFHIFLIPLMVRLLKGAEHLAESLYLRSYEDLH